MYKQAGFTVLEVILMAALSVMVSAVIIMAINPVAQAAKTRNDQRFQDVTAIANAVYMWSKSNDHTPDLPAQPTEICLSTSTDCDGLVNLSEAIRGDTYLEHTPKDPLCAQACSANGTGYTIFKTKNGLIIVRAPAAERDTTISITR